MPLHVTTMISLKNGRENKTYENNFLQNSIVKYGTRGSACFSCSNVSPSATDCYCSYAKLSSWLRLRLTTVCHVYTYLPGWSNRHGSQTSVSWAQAQGDPTHPHDRRTPRTSLLAIEHPTSAATARMFATDAAAIELTGDPVSCSISPHVHDRRFDPLGSESLESTALASKPYRNLHSRLRIAYGHRTPWSTCQGVSAPQFSTSTT